VARAVVKGFKKSGTFFSVTSGLGVVKGFLDDEIRVREIASSGNLFVLPFWIN